LLAEALPRLRLGAEAAANPWSAFSPRPARLWLEIGAGSGEHALAQAAANTDTGVIAAEVYANGTAALLSALLPDGPPAEAALPHNLLLWPEDGRHLLRLLPPGSLDRLFLLFPDPWPKARHAKRRFVHPDIVPLVAQALAPGATWRIASDDPTYQAWIETVMAAQHAFTTLPPATTRPLDWPPTRYEAKALAAGRTPLYWSFVRQSCPSVRPLQPAP